MAVTKAQLGGPPKRLRKRSKPAAEPALNAPPKTHVARPSGPLDYDVVCSDAINRFPHILKRLAE
jgi:hypothetical protein